MRMTRQLVAVAAALILLIVYGTRPESSGPAAQQAPQPGFAPLFKNPVALQLYSLRESFKTDGVPKTLAKVKAMGISHVELAGAYGLTREAFKAELDKAGLTPVAMHADIKALSSDTAGDAAQVLSDAKFYGVQYVGNAWFPHERPFDAEDAANAIAAFNKAGAAANAAGLTFFYHPHGYEFVKTGDGGTLFDTMVAKTDPALVFFELDIFWAYHGGADPVALIKAYPKRFVLTHLKDMKAGTPRNNTGGAPDDSSVALGSGVVDVKGVLEAARQSAITWHIIEEESSEPEKNIPAGFAFLKSLMGDR